MPESASSSLSSTSSTPSTPSTSSTTPAPTTTSASAQNLNSSNGAIAFTVSAPTNGGSTPSSPVRYHHPYPPTGKSTVPSSILDNLTKRHAMRCTTLHKNYRPPAPLNPTTFEGTSTSTALFVQDTQVFKLKDLPEKVFYDDNDMNSESEEDEEEEEAYANKRSTHNKSNSLSTIGGVRGMNPQDLLIRRNSSISVPRTKAFARVQALLQEEAKPSEIERTREAELATYVKNGMFNSKDEEDIELKPHALTYRDHESEVESVASEDHHLEMMMEVAYSVPPSPSPSFIAPRSKRKFTSDIMESNKRIRGVSPTPSNASLGSPTLTFLQFPPSMNGLSPGILVSAVSNNNNTNNTDVSRQPVSVPGTPNKKAFLQDPSDAINRMSL